MRIPVILVLLLVLATVACTSSTTATTLPTTATTVGSATTDTTGPDGSTSGDGPDAAPLRTTTAIAWNRVDDPEVFDGGFMNAVTTGGPGLVAVGTVEEREDAAVWVAAEPNTWERVTSESFGGIPDSNGVDGEQQMLDVTTTVDGLIVAVGSDELQEARDVDAAVWLSADGRTWEKAEDEDLGGDGYQAMGAVTSWNGVLYAGGEYQIDEAGAFLPGLWRSTDGRDWERIEHPVFSGFEAVVTDIDTRGSTLIVVGFDGADENRPLVWITRDGEDWDTVRSDEAGVAVVGEVEVPDRDTPFSLFMTGVAPSPDGWVATGTIGNPSTGVVWTSEDGYYWEVAALLPDYDRPGADVIPAAVIPTLDGMVLVGTSPLDTSGFPPLAFAVAWVSTDSGRSWAQSGRSSNSMAVEGASSPWHMGTMRDVVLSDGQLVAVGYIPVAEVTAPGDFYDQAVWVGTWG